MTTGWPQAMLGDAVEAIEDALGERYAMADPRWSCSRWTAPLN